MALFQPEPLGIKVDLEKKVDDLVENNKNLEHRIAALENLIIKLQKNKTRKSLPKGPYKPMKKNITKPKSKNKSNRNSNSNSNSKSKNKSKSKSNESNKD